MRCPGRPTGCSAASPGPVRLGGRGPHSHARWSPARRCDRRSPPCGGGRRTAGPPVACWGCRRTVPRWLCSAVPSGHAASTTQQPRWPSVGAGAATGRSTTSWAGATGSGTKAGPPAQGAGRVGERGPVRDAGALRGADGRRLLCGRCGGVPVRGDDRGRVGGGRRPVDPGAAPRSSWRSPDRQCPGTRGGGGDRALGGRRLPRGRAGRGARPAARRPLRSRCHGSCGGVPRAQGCRRRRGKGGRSLRPVCPRGGCGVSAAGPGTGTLGDLSEPIHVHVVGIGGAGMSAIATVLQAMGHTVTGSDLKESAVTDRLRRSGINVAIGHLAGNVGTADALTLSSAVAEDNPEVVEARRRGVPVLPRAQTLAAITALRRCIAVAGTHGKTTTASMLALILVEAGMRPSFLIGGEVNEIGTNAVWDSGEWIVVEADESDGTFLSLVPDIAIVTNVEADHLDHYGSFAAVRAAFEEFVASARSRRVVGGDDPVAAEIGRATGSDVVGTTPESTHRMIDLDLARSSVSFELMAPGGADLGRLAVPVPGLHNAKNAAVAAVAALAAGVPFDAAARALARFAGVARRFEFRGSVGGVTFVDDYAHLPSEVRAALAAARNGDWRRVVAVFQPHRYSRTAELWAEFGTAFGDADVVVVADVYGAGEAPVPGVSGRLVADAVRRSVPQMPVYYVAGRGDLGRTVGALLEPGDLCCTLGAGDLTSLPDELLSAPVWTSGG